jgi:hypothetical protein
MNFGSGVSGYCLLELATYVTTITSMAIFWLAIILFKKKKNGYFLFGGVVYLAIVGCVVYVNSG